MGTHDGVEEAVMAAVDPAAIMESMRRTYGRGAAAEYRYVRNDVTEMVILPPPDDDDESCWLMGYKNRSGAIRMLYVSESIDWLVRVAKALGKRYAIHAYYHVESETTH